MFSNNKMKEVRAFAERHHGNQMYGNHPYLYHLDSVVAIAKEASLDDNYIIACYLHDIIEDTNCTFKEIREEFGEEVVDLVYLVTDEIGRSRAERKDKTFKKLKGEIGGIMVKLCDRIANIWFSTLNSRKKSLMYIEEDVAFRKLWGYSYIGIEERDSFNNLLFLYNEALDEARHSLI